MLKNNGGDSTITKSDLGNFNKPTIMEEKTKDK